MIKLNLLPPTEKEILETEQKVNCFFNYFFKFFLVFVFFIFLLTVIWGFLEIQAKGMEKTVRGLEKSKLLGEVQSFEEEIYSANKHLELLAQIRRDPIVFSDILEELAEITPPNVKISNFILDKKTKKGTLDGNALDRDGFLALKSAMEKSDNFTQINSPLSNLVKSTDNNFRINFTIK